MVWNAAHRATSRSSGARSSRSSIVVLLTPAVGGMARLLGVVDRAEGGRRPSAARRPAARRPRALPRHLRPVARVPAARRRDARDPARRRGRDDGRRGRRLPRPALVGEARRPGRSRPRSRCGFGVWVHRFTFPLLGVHELPACGRRRADDRRDRRRDEHGQLPRRARRARRRRLRDLGAARSA